jgi:hypothetical protein
MQIETVLNSHLNWRTGIRSSYRQNEPPVFNGKSYFEDGYSLSYLTGFQYRLFKNAERRLSGILDADFQLGRFFANPAGIYSVVAAQFRVDWLPQAKEDNRLTAKIRGGTADGKLPFDQIFSLGMERDNPLELHAHSGTDEGKKGNAPLGNRYLLINLEWNKEFYRNAFITASLGPLLDTGKIFDSNGVFQSDGWLVDTGIQSKVKTFTGVEIIFSYARDLRRGNGLFYVSTGLPLSGPH